MTIQNYTFFSPNGTEFPVSANADAKLYLMLSSMGMVDFRRVDWAEPINTALNRQYTNTSLVVGGRYFELKNETVNLEASATNYVHANISLTDTANPVSLSVEAADNSNGVDINNDSGVLKKCIEIVSTDSMTVTGATTPKQNFTLAGDITANGSIKAESMSTTQDTTPVSIGGTGAPTGKVTYQRINGVVYVTGSGNWGATTSGQTKNLVTIPAGFRPRVQYETAGSPLGGTASMSWRVATNGVVSLTPNPGGGNTYSGFALSYPAAM